MENLQQRAKEIFLLASEFADSERDAYVEEACDGDTELAQRVHGLLTAGKAAADDIVEQLNRALEGRYEILEEAGRGGMAVVYRAYDARHDRDVALKVLFQEVTAAVGPERFLREIRIAASLQHANIVPLYDSGNADGLLYYVMPLLEGGTLQQKIFGGGPLAVEEVVSIAREVADALDYAHGKGLVHRDIKPGNILFSNGRAVLSDFGLATAFSGAEEQKLTQSGMVLGTPSYMSPEQALGQETDARSDLYSLGCVVYEMLAGDPPFKGSNVQAVLARHVSDAVPPLRSIRPQLPLGIDRTLRKALAKVPADRYATAGALVEALSTQRARGVSREVQVAVGIAVFVAALALWITRPWESNVKLHPDKTEPLTFSAGPEYSGLLSPDSRFLVYSHTDKGTMDIYVQELEGGRPPIRRTTGVGDEILPRWSRSGAQIAYVKGNGSECDIYTIPHHGGSPRKLAETRIPPIHSFYDAMAALGTDPWSPEPEQDKYLLFSRRLETGDLAIYQVEVKTQETTRVTSPPAGVHDLGASWSHDGKWIVFTRSHGGVQDLWLREVSSGAERSLLSNGFVNQDPSFFPGDEHVIFTSNVSAMEKVWAIHIRTEICSQLTFGVGKDWYPSVSDDGMIVYTRWSHQTDLWRVNVDNPEETNELTDWTQDNFVGRYSPVGNRIAYQSTRTGNAEIYVMNLDVDMGHEDRERNISEDPGTDLLPTWSPSGEEIAYLSNRLGVMNIFVANADRPYKPKPLSNQEIHIPSKVWAVSLSLRWTPDGTAIGYLMTDAQGSSLYTIDRAPPANIQHVYDGVLRFDWYKGRDRIVYTTMTDKGIELRAANVNTAAEVVLWSGPHSEMILAPDGNSVALVLSASHFNQSLYLLDLDPPTTGGGLPTRRGEPRLIADGKGTWHVHNGGWSRDGKWIVYTRDTDDGDIFSLTLKDE